MRSRISNLVFIVIGIAVAVALVVFLAPNASANPDGLETVAADTGIDSEVADHALADGPLADYGVHGVDSTWGATVLAGVIGIAATFVVCAGVVFLVRRNRRRTTPATSTTG